MKKLAKACVEFVSLVCLLVLALFISWLAITGGQR